MILTFVMNLVMVGVMLIRRDRFHYLTASDDALSWVRADQIMKLGHAIPSVIISLLLGLWGAPHVSDWYAAKLEQNDVIVPIFLLSAVLPLLLTNGFLIEEYLERTNPAYKQANAAVRRK